MVDHIYINRYEKELERKKRAVPRGGSGPREDKESYIEVQRTNINEILAIHEQNRLTFSPYFDPNLIFRIKVTGNPDENDFANFLRRCQLRYISPSPASGISSSELTYRVSHAEKDNLDEIRQRLEQYKDHEQYKNYFEIIDSVEKIPADDKIGKGLIEKRLSDNEMEYVDVELWRMEDERLKKALDGLIGYIKENRGDVTDQIITKSFCLIRAKIDKKIFEKILQLSEISIIDRPPRASFFQPHELEVPIDDINAGSPPPDDAPAIIVLDSGVLSGHPFLENGVGDEVEGAHLIDPQTFPNNYVDEVGHGTKVAGVALYGDLRKCNDERNFSPEFFILSGKVLYKKEDEDTGVPYAGFDDRVTIESLINETIKHFIERYPNSKIVNISFQTEKETFNLRQQHRISSLIDEIAKEKMLVFVVSAGNTSPVFPSRYPHYLLENTPGVKIFEPASSAYALTVGSIAQEYVPIGSQAYLFPKSEWPSLFTAVGPGLNGMVKPEFVEDGGNEPYSDGASTLQNGVFVLNPEWREESKLLTTDCGTSFSAPKITNFVARLFKKFPDYHHNTIKALLLSSAMYPADRPAPLNIEINNADSTQRSNLLNVYGYGKPNINHAEESDTNRVCFVTQDAISIDGVHFYELYLPQEFYSHPGKREISVSLVYDPLTTGTRIDYFGVKMSFILFKNTTGEELEQFSTKLAHDGEDVDEETEYTSFPKIDLQPSMLIRSKGIHQKGSIVNKSTPSSIEPSKPLVLAVFCKGNWMKKKDYEDFKQTYSVVVNVRHQAQINLYNRVVSMIRTRIKV